MKIRRNRIEASINAQLTAWYESHGTVHWA